MAEQVMAFLLLFRVRFREEKNTSVYLEIDGSSGCFAKRKVVYQIRETTRSCHVRVFAFFFSDINASSSFVERFFGASLTRIVFGTLRRRPQILNAHGFPSTLATCLPQQACQEFSQDQINLTHNSEDQCYRAHGQHCRDSHLRNQGGFFCVCVCMLRIFFFTFTFQSSLEVFFFYLIKC